MSGDGPTTAAEWADFFAESPERREAYIVGYLASSIEHGRTEKPDVAGLVEYVLHRARA